MSFSDETLMAFADGELDEPLRSAVERAMRSDPAIAARIRKHHALRSNVFAAFTPVLEEAVPQRLQAASRPGKVIHLNTARAARADAADDAAPRRRWSWRDASALATTLLVGVLAGGAGVLMLDRDARLASVAGADGILIAQGTLADALTRQLGSATRPDSEVKIGISFVSREGSYCRSFMMGLAAGVACRSGDQWKVPMMAQAAPAGAAYREAGNDMPAAVTEDIERRMAGQALDARAEQAAQLENWRR